MGSFDDQLRTKNIEMYSEFIQQEKREIESKVLA
jgi:hypothetical protein